LTYHDHAAGRLAAPPTGPSPGTAKVSKFDFWSSMADLIRLVLRSRAQGLKVRLAAALFLVL
jgi:hypothetical protein